MEVKIEGPSKSEDAPMAEAKPASADGQKKPTEEEEDKAIVKVDEVTFEDIIENEDQPYRRWWSEEPAMDDAAD